MTSRGGSSRGGEHGSQARSRREVDNSSSDSSDSSGLLAGSQEEGKEKENGGGERSRREVDNSWWKKQVDPEKREQSPPAPERNKSMMRKKIKKHLAGKGLVEREDEEENRFLNLSEEIEVTKETFVNKMSEMQENLLLMVEHCLDFEKDLVKLKEENRRMSIEIKDLREEIKCLKEEEKKSSSGNADGELIFTNSQHSVQQSVIPGGEVVAKPERCRIVTVSSGSLDSHPSPSKSALPATEKEETSYYPGPGPSITWHRPLSLPSYTVPPRHVPAPPMTRPQVVLPHVTKFFLSYNHHSRGPNSDFP